MTTQDKDIVKTSLEHLLVVRNLRKYFRTPRGLVRAVDEVTFTMDAGETLALVGESGSGKTTIAHIIMGFYTPTDGVVMYKGINIGIPIEKRPLRLKKEIQIVFQDPATSLNPKKTVKDILESAIRVHEKSSRLERFRRILELMSYVGLAEEHLFKLPGELGGGEKQLIALARALAVDPAFIILDEPTSALDVSAQSKVLKTLSRIQRDRGVSYLLITHDLGVVRNISKRVIVMYLGKICEVANTDEFFRRPTHPYTQMLLSSIPVMTEEDERILPAKIESRGEIPSAINPPPGCRFHTRCPYVMDVCKKEEPPAFNVGDAKHLVNCWLHSPNARI
ncbi:MAG: ABC transporter ATP-binding protein [Zestosphaera sp.]